MDGFRYVLALLVVVMVPPAFLLWLTIHPFVRFWRRVGPAGTYVAVGTLFAAGIAGLYRVREPLLAVEFGTGPLLWIAAAPWLAAGGWLVVAVRLQLPVRTQLGLPELAPERHPQPLLTEGIYGRVRHPRYLAAAFGLLGWALLSNYLAAYVVWLLYLPAIQAVALFEERELRDRFGEAYDDYCRRVPRWWLRLRV